MHTSRRSGRRSASALCVALVLGGCAVEVDNPTSGATAPDPDRTERIAAVRATRELVGPGAVALVEAAAAARATALEALAAPPADPLRWPDVAAAAAAAVDALLDEATRTASEAAAAVPRTEDTAAAVERLGSARRTVERWAADVADVLGRPAVLAGHDAELARIAAAWDTPGSRRQQLAALDVLAADATAVAAAAADDAAALACAASSDVRARAAANVATATRELRDLVAAYRGNEFDARRAELRPDPDGLPAGARATAAADDADCLADGLLAVPEDVAALVDDLERLLTPDELAADPDRPDGG